jgi:hypothetical protein
VDVGCLTNADFEKGDNCVRSVYLSEIMTRTSNLKNSIFLLIDLQSNPLKHPQSNHRSLVFRQNCLNKVQGMGWICRSVIFLTMKIR